jgi:hypothetical protein
MRSGIDYISPFASGSPYDGAHTGLWHPEFARISRRGGGGVASAGRWRTAGL